MSYQHARKSTLICLVSLMSLAITATACTGEEDAGCIPNSETIVPGKGVALTGATVCLGQTRHEVEASLGSVTSQELGAVGTRAVYPKHNLSLLYSKGADDSQVELTAIYLDQGTTVKTVGGVGLGSPPAQVKADLGEPATDPFLGDWWYPQKGIVVQFENSKVAAIQLMEPQAK